MIEFLFQAKSWRENGQSMIVECLVNKDSKMTHFIQLTIKSAIAQHQTKAWFKRHKVSQK